MSVSKNAGVSVLARECHAPSQMPHSYVNVNTRNRCSSSIQIQMRVTETKTTIYRVVFQIFEEARVF